MLCLPLAALNPSATPGPSPQPRPARPSRGAGSCLHQLCKIERDIPQATRTEMCALNCASTCSTRAYGRTENSGIAWVLAHPNCGTDSLHPLQFDDRHCRWAMLRPVDVAPTSLSKPFAFIASGEPRHHHAEADVQAILDCLRRSIRFKIARSSCQMARTRSTNPEPPQRSS